MIYIKTVVAQTITIFRFGKSYFMISFNLYLIIRTVSFMLDPYLSQLARVAIASGAKHMWRALNTE
jgi:hypothetical protein